MWPIFLKILSIIGIVLACILGVVILLLLLILLCPVTYKAEGEAHESNYTSKIKIKYLFGIVRAWFDYPEPGIIYAKALWFTLYDSSDNNKDKQSNHIEKKVKDKDKENTKNASYAKEAFESEENTEAEFEALDIDENGMPLNKASEYSEVNNDADNNSAKQSNNGNKEAKRSKEKKKPKSDKEKKKRILNPIYHIKKTWENFKFKIISKIQYIIKDIKYYYALWQHDDTQALFVKVKKHGLKILKIIAPKKGNVNIVFGTGSPDSTGQIYGLCTAIFTRWPKAFTIQPDFENKVIDGTLFVSGHFCLLSLLIHALPIVLSRKLRITKARFDAHGEKKDISLQKTLKKHEKVLKDLEEEYST